MVMPRRVRDIVVILGRYDGVTIRQDDWHVWVRLHEATGPEYLAELSIASTSSGAASGNVMAGNLEDMMPPWGTIMLATPKGNMPPLSNELKIDVSSIPVPAILPPPS